jgi:hypothetical protein
MRTDTTAALIQAAPWIFIISGVANLALSTIWRSHLVRFYQWNHRKAGGRFSRWLLPARWYAGLDAYWSRPDSQLRKSGEVACALIVIIIGAAWIWMRR